MIFDSHAHYDDKVFDIDREKILDGLYDKGVEAVVNVGANIASSVRAVNLAKDYPMVYAAVGVHPEETGELTKENINEIEVLIGKPKVVAVGEIGLDYYQNKNDKDMQVFWFEKQLEIALKSHKPVIIHSREAARDTYDTLKKEKYADIRGIIHCYSYSPEMAKSFIEMGYYIGIGGVVTFKNAKRVKETVESISIDNMVLETDCPYLAPEPHRGERNDSTYIHYVAEKIAQLKGMFKEDVIEITCNNAKKIYQLEGN